MGYSDVKIPRFYISFGDYWRSVGQDVKDWNTIRTNKTTKISLSDAAYKFLREGDEFKRCFTYGL